MKADVDRGERAEEFIRKELEGELGSLKKMEGKFKDYDFITPDGYTLEVKFDEISKTTGNVGIEYLCNGELSGISCTKADEWVHIYYYPPYWVYSRVPVSKLRGVLKANESIFQKTKGGDGDRVRMVLLTVELFTDLFGYKIIKT